MTKKFVHPSNGDKKVVHSVKDIDGVFESVTAKTLHGTGVAKTPDDVLRNLRGKKQ